MVWIWGVGVLGTVSTSVHVVAARFLSERDGVLASVDLLFG